MNVRIDKCSSVTDSVYSMLLNEVEDKATCLPEQVMLGMTWTAVVSEGSIGLGMSPGTYTRTLPWAGALNTESVQTLSQWIKSWNMHESSVGLAAINALVNRNNALLDQAVSLEANAGSANLAVFDYFRPGLQGQSVAVIGHYPGIEKYTDLDMVILERTPEPGDLPDPACEYILPEADWVFLSASTLANKTFPRLAELSSQATLVLMGPSVPWLESFTEFGVDYLAGTRVKDPQYLIDTIMQGGGTRIFEGGVEYCVADLTETQMESTRDQIRSVVSQRDALKREMEAWYANPDKGRSPVKYALVELDRQLALLDTRYRRLWNAASKSGDGEKFRG